MKYAIDYIEDEIVTCENIETKEKMLEDYEDENAWGKKMLVNIAKAGYFSADRTIAQYNEDIWHLS